MSKRFPNGKHYDLDYILETGDAKFKLLNILQPLFLHELPLDVVIKSQNINIELLKIFYGILSQNDIFVFHKLANPRDIGNGLIFMTAGSSFSMIWSKNNYFLFDSHNRDGNGCFVAEGNSVLLMFSSLSDIECYIKREYAKNLANFDTTQFECQNVKVTCVGAATILNKARKNTMARKRHLDIVGTPQYDKIKKCKHESAQQKRLDIVGTSQHDKIKQSMRASKQRRGLELDRYC